MFGTNPMNFDFFQQRWLLNFVPNLMKDMKSETSGTIGSRKVYKYGKEDKGKSLGEWFGIWENFLSRSKIEVAVIPRAETVGEKFWPRRQIDVAVSPKAETLWEKLWPRSHIEVVDSKKVKHKSSFKKAENKRIHKEGFAVWYLSLGANRFEPARILKPEKNRSFVKTQIGKPQQSMTPHNKVDGGERFWSMNLIETVRIYRSERNNNNGRVENRHKHDKSSWEIFRQLNQTTINMLRPKNKSKNTLLDKSKPQKGGFLQDTFGIRDFFWQRSFHKTYNNTRKTENNKPLKDRFSHDKLGVWELFWRTYQTEESRIPKPQKNSFKGKTEISKPFQDRSLQEMFGAWKLNWKRNEIETASILQAEKNKPYQDLFRFWQHIQQSLPWNQSKNKETDEFEILESGCAIPKFTPYMAKIPWHTGARAFLSQLFPRYGNYCGPNWSSGKNQGALLWDKKPVDFLDYCCFCHDIGYDTHDQAELLKADLAFLECLGKTQIAKNGNSRLAEAYRSMCITGLKTVLIPYRQQLLKQIYAQHILASKITRLNSRKSAMQPQ